MAFLLVRRESQTSKDFLVNLSLPKAGEVEGIYEVKGSWAASSAEGCDVLEVEGPGIDYGDFLKPTEIPDLKNVPATTQRRKLRIDLTGVAEKSDLTAILAKTAAVLEVVDPAIGRPDVP